MILQVSFVALFVFLSLSTFFCVRFFQAKIFQMLRCFGQLNNVLGRFKLLSVFLVFFKEEERVGFVCCRLRDVVQFGSVVAIAQIL